jgi:uncharacterized protein
MTASTTPAVREAPTLAAPAIPHALRSAGAFIVLCMVLAGGGALATPTMSATVPFLLALVPAAIALGITSFEGKGSTGRLIRLLWKRPVGRRWYLVIALPVVWALGTIAVGVALGRSSDDVFAGVLPSVLIVPLVVFLPALAEELAWRGFAVPRLMTAFSPLQTGLLLSAPWVVMHVVLMLPGGINEGLALWSAILSLVAYSVVLTWIFVGSGGSVVLAALVHAGFNGVVPLMRGIDVEASWDIRAVLAAGIAIAIVLAGGFRRISASRQAAAS